MNEHLAHVVDLVRKMPQPKTFTGAREDLTQCTCACGKLKPVTEMQPFYTGKIHAVDNVCTECIHHTRGLSVIVCAACRRVIARMVPYRDRHGFTFLPNKAYHVNMCPDRYCGGRRQLDGDGKEIPGSSRVEQGEPSTIIEQAMYQADHGVKLDRWVQAMVTRIRETKLAIAQGRR